VFSFSLRQKFRARESLSGRRLSYWSTKHQNRYCGVATLILDKYCGLTLFQCLSNFFRCFVFTGTTPILIAVKKRSLDIVQVLLEYGADPLLKDVVRTIKDNVFYL
jgi:hypothetical protein